MKSIWKSKRFVIGLTYIVVLVIASFIYGFYFKEDTLKPMRLLYDENGELIAASPFSPKQMPPLTRYNIWCVINLICNTIKIFSKNMYRNILLFTNRFRSIYINAAYEQNDFFKLR